MSTISATLCLFSAALCNVGNVDQSVFGNQQSQQAANQFVDSGINLFNQGAQAFGLGGIQVNRQPNSQKKPRQPHESPCPGKFKYVTNNQQWKGIAKFPNINPDKETNVYIDFILPGNINQQQASGKIDLVNDPNELYNDISNGLPVLLETSFTSQNPVPKISAIYKNQKLVCGGNTDPQGQFRSFRLHYSLKPFESSTDDRFDSEGELQPQIPPHQNQQYQLINTPSGPSQGNQFQNDDSVCGVPVAGFTQSLVIGGQAAGHGEWPWLVAFYRSKNGNLEFICGGSLISSKNVLTAAHCVQDKQRESIMQTQNALFFIGKHNLVEWNESGYEKKGAKSFKIHPDWKPFETSYDSDLALIELDSAVRYSKFIRPICLWSGSDDLTKVVGQVGIVAGWGKNEKGELNTEFPKKVNVPIVSDGQCLRTHEAFVHITSERTFCAGGRAGEGPCQGDSGGGLVLKIGKKWFLRGIVSASLRDGSSCDVNSYAIFTDVAKFIPWIKENL